MKDERRNRWLARPGVVPPSLPSALDQCRQVADKGEDPAPARLRGEKPDLARGPVHLLPPEGKDLAPTPAGEVREPDCIAMREREARDHDIDLGAFEEPAPDVLFLEHRQVRDPRDLPLFPSDVEGRAERLNEPVH